MDIEQFYDENPKRRSSQEFEYGTDWSDADDRRCEISWILATGELYLMSAPIEPILSDGFGDEWVERLPTQLVTVEVLDVVPTRAAVDARLHGWRDAMGEPNSVEWVRGRLTNRVAPSTTGGVAASDADRPASIRGAGTGGPQASFMILTLLDQLEKVLPASAGPTLAAYRDEAGRAGSDSTAEWHRAYACAQWAVDLAAAVDGVGSGHARRSREVVREVTATIGAEILDLEALPLGRSTSPRFQAELAWVEEAARIAKTTGAELGWPRVPWEPLLQELLPNVAPST